MNRLRLKQPRYVVLLSEVTNQNIVCATRIHTPPPRIWFRKSSTDTIPLGLNGDSRPTIQNVAARWCFEVFGILASRVALAQPFPAYDTSRRVQSAPGPQATCFFRVRPPSTTTFRQWRCLRTMRPPCPASTVSPAFPASIHSRVSTPEGLHSLFLVAVGTIIADRPPHRTVQAALPHTAPTLEKASGAATRTSPIPWDTHAPRCVGAGVGLNDVLLGPHPFLPRLR